MQTGLSFLLIFLLSQASFGHGLCDREVIRKALQQAKDSEEAKAYAKSDREKVSRPVRKNLNQVFKKIEKAVFGRSVLQIQEDLPMIPPMATINDQGTITISPQTLDSLNKNLSRPPDGAAFIIAHEIGHFVQHVSFNHSQKKLSPNGLENANPKDEQAFNQLHAETDCIAVEILYQSGYAITDDIFKTLQIIKDECKTQRSGDFCRSADEVRKATVQEYIQKYYGGSATKNQNVPSPLPNLKSPSSAAK
jgi:hypothetical protein